jgi:hypothetical protein
MAANEATLASSQSEHLSEGQLLDIQTRSIQKLGGSTASLGVNLTNLGVRIHGLTAEDEAMVHVYTNGIWIERSSSGDE